MLTQTVIFDFSETPKSHFTYGWGKWSLTGEDALFSILEESIHHRRQLNQYLRILEIEPIFVYDY